MACVVGLVLLVSLAGTFIIWRASEQQIEHQLLAEITARAAATRDTLPLRQRLQNSWDRRHPLQRYSSDFDN